MESQGDTLLMRQSNANPHRSAVQSNSVHWVGKKTFKEDMAMTYAMQKSCTHFKM